MERKEISALFSDEIDEFFKKVNLYEKFTKGELFGASFVIICIYIIYGHILSCFFSIKKSNILQWYRIYRVFYLPQ